MFSLYPLTMAALEEKNNQNTTTKPKPNVTFLLAVSTTYIFSAMGTKKDFPAGEFN